MTLMTGSAINAYILITSFKSACRMGPDTVATRRVADAESCSTWGRDSRTVFHAEGCGWSAETDYSAAGETGEWATTWDFPLSLPSASDWDWAGRGHSCS